MIEWWQQYDCEWCGAPCCWCLCLEELQEFNGTKPKPVPLEVIFVGAVIAVTAIALGGLIGWMLL